MGPQELLSLHRQDAGGLSSAPGAVMGAGRSPIPGAGVEQLGWESRRPPRPIDSVDHDLANLGQGGGSVTLHPGSRQSSIIGQQGSGATDTNGRTEGKPSGGTWTLQLSRSWDWSPGPSSTTQNAGAPGDFCCQSWASKLDCLLGLQGS